MIVSGVDTYPEEAINLCDPAIRISQMLEKAPSVSVEKLLRVSWVHILQMTTASEQETHVP